MTIADRIFIRNCRNIIDSPFSDEGMDVRPKWEDGTPAHTRKVFGLANGYALEEEFPIMTLRRIYWKTALKEILWIYQKHSNNIHDLDAHIWDQWADETGSIGKAYGYQIGKVTHYPEGDFNQMEKVIYDLKHNPMSRSIMTNMYCVEELPDMHLRPCAYSMTYNVTRDTKTGKMYLNGILNQRSQDMITANNWNTVQYAMLLLLVAKEVNMIPGHFIHVIADAHIYDRHIPIAQDMINRGISADANTFKAPKVYVADSFTDFWHATPDDIVVENYQYDDTQYRIDVAV